MIDRLYGVTTAHVADACMRAGVPVRVGPAGFTSVPEGAVVRGRARPVRHYGSVDVFLESIESASSGEVMVIDNGGRLDEGCIGDLVVIEAKGAGLAGLIVWGLHRDTVEIGRIGLPVFSLGTNPAGPRRLDEREAETFTSARVGEVVVTRDDWVFADPDGVVFVEDDRLEEVVTAAEAIRDVERSQSEKVGHGVSLREQFGFDDYLGKREHDASYTFRRHLEERGGAIET